MNPAICEREQQTASAILDGTIPPEIAAHAERCLACSEIMLVAQFLRTNALSDQERTAVPDPQRIWHKAQHEARQQALRKALRPIRFMKFAACVAFACSPWLRWLLPLGQELSASWSKAFDFNLASISRPWPATATEATLLFGLSGTIILLALSSWFMLREE